MPKNAHIHVMNMYNTCIQKKKALQLKKKKTTIHTSYTKKIKHHEHKKAIIFSIPCLNSFFFYQDLDPETERPMAQPPHALRRHWILQRYAQLDTSSSTIGELVAMGGAVVCRERYMR